MKRARQPVVWTIAGFDPSSGAGVTADIKTLAAHGCYGVACITALTVQSTRGVRRVEPLSAHLVRQTLEDLLADLPPAAIRIGMLGFGAVAAAAAGFLERHRLPHIVLDPVLRSSSGARLLDKEGQRVLVRRLLPLAEVITPNVEEAAALAGIRVKDANGLRAAAGRLHALGARNVVVTGGHLQRPVDLVSLDGGRRQIQLVGRPVATRSTHGTGCAFATALAANLALGLDVAGAASAAAAYVRQALRKAVPIGRGTGPLNHLFML